MRRARRLLLAIAAASALALTVPVGATAQEAPSIVVENGMTQPVFSFANAIFETHWVETNLDTNSDGQPDRVMFQVARPRETQTHGMKVPVVMELSPYRSGTWGSVPYHSDLNPDRLPQSFLSHRRDQVHAGMATADGVGLAAAAAEDGAGGPGPNLPTAWDDYYVPRGYGVVIGQSVGTAQSDGCGTVGDDAETQSAKAIIDWLNGRAVAYDARVGGNPVTADWSTGDVGMIGSSYNGTIPNQVATTGVEGLKTIVPVVAISDWYNYYRENGLVVAPGGFQGEDADILGKYISGQARSLGECADYFAWMTQAQDRITGDYNAFWDARNYLPLARRVEASVFVVDGRNDWNVKPSQWGQWWDELSHFGKDRKIWLHNGGHGTPGNNASYTLPDGTSWTYQQTVNRWFDSELYGIDNGIKDEPRAIVQREPAFGSVNQVHADWPVPGSADVTVALSAASSTAPGGLTAGKVVAPRQSAQSFTDNGRNRRPVNTFQSRPPLISNPDVADPDRLVYLSDVLEAPVHLSGTPSIRLRASVDNASAANLSAYLVDYGPPGSTSATMVTRGWMDVQNRNRRDKTDPIQIGHAYDFRWDFHPDDYVFQAGRRIGVVVFSTDYDFTLRPLPGTQLTVQPGFSSVTLPIVGGSAAAGF
jgi:X-Pro dipeptidyl-peptidase